MTTAKQERPNSNWEGMLKRWSVDQRTTHRVHSYTSMYDHPLLSDGTDPRAAPKWRGSAQEWYRINEQSKYYYMSDRIYHITCGFVIVGDDTYHQDNNEDEDKDNKDELEREKGLLDVLDELQAYAEFTDVASVLHSEGCLFSFLRDALSNKHASVRAKISEVVTTMVQNYPTSQRLLIKEKLLQLLLNNFTSDPDATSRTKVLGAISSLIRNKKSGIIAFRREKGYATLRKALISGSVCQREGAALKDFLVLARRKGRNCGRQFNLHLSTCSCSYHRLKQFKLHLKKKQFKQFIRSSVSSELIV